ncbi:hypothetical protein CORC01_08217 [Colletotrichum orchidophilum]|uniref:Uncharacterized protein n=1 Tax=Colletotrichum orchidophilum TaxID=1209926 RepID=A0A1G4B4X8_9PEZI|nr:uncharacterized protein CORC01_08217 [Colletotrichum orchidophilum]OHE96454.1 hypothetical protein CORC01_08217 [Colletotrichum orchidophilum]
MTGPANARFGTDAMGWGKYPALEEESLPVWGGRANQSEVQSGRGRNSLILKEGGGGYVQKHLPQQRGHGTTSAGRRKAARAKPGTKNHTRKQKAEDKRQEEAGGSERESTRDSFEDQAIGFPLRQAQDAVQSESDAPKFPIQADEVVDSWTSTTPRGPWEKKYIPGEATTGYLGPHGVRSGQAGSTRFWDPELLEDAKDGQEQATMQFKC